MKPAADSTPCNPDDEPIDLDEASRRLRERGIDKSTQTLYRWASQGLIPVTKVGRYRTTIAAIMKALRPAEAA